MKHGIILFGHGSRNARWAEPFYRLESKLRIMCGLTSPVIVAFLEWMSPSLEKAICLHNTECCKRITIIPIFIGQGHHIRNDLPKLIDKCRIKYPDVEIFCSTAIGDDNSILNAIANYCLDQINV